MDGTTLPSEQLLDILDWLADEAANRAAEIAAEKITKEAGAPRYLTTKEAADYLRSSRQRLYDLVSARVLSPYKDGRKSLYLRDDLDRYLEAGKDS